jgi:hypothetical protein
MRMRGRIAGERKAAEYIASEFKRIGLIPVGDLHNNRRNYFQQFRFQAWHPPVPWQVLTSKNVIGLIRGTDPTLKMR